MNRGLHVAAGAHILAIDGNHGVLFHLQQPFVESQGAVFDSLGEFAAVGFELIEFGLELLFEIVHLADLGVDVGLDFGGLLLGVFDDDSDFLSLFHEVELFVLQFADGLFAILDLISESLVFLVLLGLQLLLGILGDLIVLGGDLVFEVLALGFDLVGLGLGVVENGLALGHFGAHGGALGFHGVQFRLGLVDLLVAFLKDEEFFDDFEHVDLENWVWKPIGPVKASQSPVWVFGLAGRGPPGGGEGGWPVAMMGRRFFRMTRILRMVLLTAILLGSLMPWRAPGASSEAAAEPASEALRYARLLNQAFVEAAAKAAPSVAVIVVEQKFRGGGAETRDGREDAPRSSREDFREWWRRQLEESPMEGRGSGVVIREDGYILTNAHVVDGAEKITARFKDGRSFAAEIVGVDRRSEVAVIKIDGDKLPAAPIGDSDATRVGEFAIAIGAPFELDYSVTFGHVSAVGRSEIVAASELMDQNFIQTDASINPGNSGGPLVNIEGRVVGINTIIRGIGTGIGFAIPINFAMKVADELIEKGSYVRSWVGVEVTDFGEFPRMRDFSGGVQEGVILVAVHPGGPAAESALEPGDIVTRVAGREVTTRRELIAAVRGRDVGDAVAMDYIRINEEGKPVPMSLRLEPGVFPERVYRRARSRWGGGRSEASVKGISIMDLTEEMAADYRAPLEAGVVLTHLEGDYDTEFLGPGDIITKIGGRRVTGVESFKRAVGDVDFSRGVVVKYISDHPLRRDWKRMEILASRP